MERIEPMGPEEMPGPTLDDVELKIPSDMQETTKTKAQQLKTAVQQLESEDPEAAALLKAKLVQEFVQEEAFQKYLTGLAAERLPIDNFIGSGLEERLLNAVYDAIQEALTSLIETGDVDPRDLMDDIFSIS